MYLLQTIYIKILSPFSYKSIRFNRKIREAIIFICIVLCTLLVIGSYTSVDSEDKSTPLGALIDFAKGLGDTGRAVAGLVLLLIIILVSVKDELHKVEWKWYTVSLWMLCSILIIITGIFHSIGDGYLISQIIIMIIFPCLYFVWQNRGDIEVLYDIISRAISFMVIVYGIYCVLMYSYTPEIADGLRYSGSMSDPNYLGFFASIGCMVSLYMISRVKNKCVVFYGISLGISTALLSLTLSRGAFIAVVINLAVFVLWYIRDRMSLVKLGSVIIVICITFGLFSMFIDNKSDNSNAVISGLSNNSIVYAEDSNDESQQPSISIIDRFKGFNSINQFSAGRLDVWLAYYKYLNFAGNDVEYSIPIIVNVYGGSGTHYYYLAHNTPLEIAFRCGVPAGILYIMIELMALYMSIRLLFKSKTNRRPYYLFTIMGIISFVAISILGTVALPFSRDIAMIFYFALIPFFMKNNIIISDEVGGTDA